jgi:hypothetical protein
MKIYTLCIRVIDMLNLPIMDGCKLKPISCNDQVASKLLLSLKMVKSGMKESSRFF